MEGLITKAVGAYLNSLAILSPRKAGEQGVTIFCYPIRPSMKSYHKSFLESSENFDFILQGVRLQAYRWGNGPRKVLFLHGWQSHSFRWKKYIESLSKEEFTVYAFDAPGHGFSNGSFLSVPFYSEAIKQFVARIGAIDTVIAHSMGGFAIVYALYKIPLLPVNRLVLMASPGEASDFIKVYGERLSLTDRTVNCTLNRFEEIFGQAIEYFSVSKFAESLMLPGIIIHDQKDEEAPYEYARQINKAWKHSHLITTNGLGHNLKSQDVMKTVLDFVNGTVGKEFSMDEYRLIPTD
jgi:pimeloyl-ACP methyl ester carboxylesterase